MSALLARPQPLVAANDTGFLVPSTSNSPHQGDFVVKPVRCALALGRWLFGVAAGGAFDQHRLWPPTPRPRRISFVAAVNQELRDNYVEVDRGAVGFAETYISGDTEVLVAKANERALGRLSANVEKSKAFIGAARPLAPATQRGIDLRQAADRDAGTQGSGQAGRADPDRLAPQRRLWLGQVLHRREQTRHLPQSGPAQQGAGGKPRLGRRPRSLDCLAQHSPAACARTTCASPNWSTTARGEMGYGDAGDMWRSAYDMSAADFRKETDRLCGSQVRAAVQGPAVLRAPTSLISQVPGQAVQGRHDSGAHHRQHVVAGLVGTLPPAGTLCRRVSNLDVDAALKAKAVHAAEPWSSAPRTSTPPSASLPCPKSFYEKVAVRASGRPRRGLPRQRLGPQPPGRRAHQDVHQRRTRKTSAPSTTSWATSITTWPTTIAAAAVPGRCP